MFTNVVTNVAREHKMQVLMVMFSSLTINNDALISHPFVILTTHNEEVMKHIDNAESQLAMTVRNAYMFMISSTWPSCILPLLIPNLPQPPDLEME